MKITRLALILSVAALLLLLIGGPGYRLGLWDLGFGLLGVSRYALFLGAGGALLALIFLALPKTRRGNRAALTLALIVGLGVAAVPLYVRNVAQSLPMIHDISTDTLDPPQFVAVRPLRAEAPNPAEYPGAETAAQQRAGYPDLGPLQTSLSPSQLYDQARATVAEMDWDLVAENAELGRIEATDTTFWYGFKDDIVIRIRATDDGSRLDIRSKSRVGRSDLGANAARIRDYINLLEARLAAM